MMTITHQSRRLMLAIGAVALSAIVLGCWLATYVDQDAAIATTPKTHQVSQAAESDSVHVTPKRENTSVNQLRIDPTKLSPAEQEMLKQLPPICISDLPKMDVAMPELRQIPDHSHFTVRDLPTSTKTSRDNSIENREASAGDRSKAAAIYKADLIANRGSEDPNLQQAEFIDSNTTAHSNSRSTLPAQFLIDAEGQQSPNMTQRYNLGSATPSVAKSNKTNPPPTENNVRLEQGYSSPVTSATSQQDLSSNSVEWESRTATLPNPHAGLKHSKAINPNPGTDPHLEIYSRSAYPSAQECAVCHQQIYDEWASSSHAYAAVSPMFHAFEDKINMLSQGTIGYFCLRCHAPVATTMGLRRDQPIWDGPKVFKEGVTCVACHRVKSTYTKANGERRMEPGDIYAPVYGAADGRGVDIVRKYKDHFKVKTADVPGPGQPLHRRAIQFEEISKSTFCVSCHQVAVQPGIKLEVVWDQYRGSPAFREGISCQDCHMGRVPGVNEGYSTGPGAIVNGKVVNAERKHANHIFYGPGYSIAHPGVFPFTKEAERWTFNQWLEFDWRAGWGTEEFENALADGRFQATFPIAWQNVDDRYDAREIVDLNLKKLAYKKDLRRQVLENGSKLDGPFFTTDPIAGRPLTFRYCVTNLNKGHNMPSGSLGAQPQLWLNVVLTGPDGNRVWETGYLDSNGDLADNHSLDVLARKVPLDEQLLNFQTKFLTTNVKGTDREMYLPINVDIDQLPFLRPAPQPVTVLNHPPFIRMEAHSIPPTGSRNAKFVVPSRLMQQRGTYRLSARLRSRAEPIYFMRFCEATPEMERMMNEWMVDAHLQSVSFEVR